MSFSFQSLINALQSFLINGCNSEFNDRRLEPGLLEGIVRGWSPFFVFHLRMK